MLVLFMLALQAQDIKLIINGVEYSGTKRPDGNIEFTSLNSTLVSIDKIKEISADIKYYKTVAHEDSIKIAAFKRIVETSEKLEKSADTLINSQKAIIITADSLYAGYKNLYHDLKRLADINTFSITPGIGVVNIPDISPQVNLVFNLGFEYNKINLNALVGKKYQGLTVGYRIGF